MIAIELGGEPPRAILEGTQEEIRALAPLLGADLPVTVGPDPLAELAWSLSTYAAAVDWGGGQNTVGWLRGLRERIEAVQEHLRRTGRAGVGMVTEGPRLLDGRGDLDSGDWEVVVGQDDAGQWWWRIDGQDGTIAEGEDLDTKDEAEAAAEAAMERDRG